MKQMATLEITGNVRDRFIQAAALLRRLDLVRGEPTTYSLDHDDTDIPSASANLLKRKFLDSFALVCAIRRDGDTVSAACLEEGRPEGTMIRVASNAGVSPTTLGKLREIIEILNKIASRDAASFCTESDILFRIISLDITKIRGYLKELRQLKGVFLKSFESLERELPSSASAEFLDWAQKMSSIFDLPNSPEPETLLDYIQLAQDARRHYADTSEIIDRTIASSLAPCMALLFKLGRYGVAARAFVKLALQAPGLFCPMMVESVPASQRTPYTISENAKPLSAVLRRILPDDVVEKYITRLSSIWNVDDAEKDFRSACSMDLVVHAELQLISFYDHHPDLQPSFRFIGVSKKSCYLCQSFLNSHPSAYGISSCHQKLYLPWIAPPSSDPKVYRQYKDITSIMSRMLEGAIIKHLKSRLGIAKRSVPPDSTAGVSLTGLSDVAPAKTMTVHTIDDTEQTTTAQHKITPDQHMKKRVEHQIYGPSSSSTNIDTFQPPSPRPSVPPVNRYSAMVFHIRREHSSYQQDIVLMLDILDRKTGQPSWQELLKIMRRDDGIGLAFQENIDYLSVHEGIRVTCQRQFRASIQFLMNLNVLNVAATVCVKEEVVPRAELL